MGPAQLARSTRYAKARLMSTKATSSMTPAPKVNHINLRSIGSKGSYSPFIFSSSSDKRGSVMSHPFTTGGSTPWKNSHEINSPTQMMYPNRQST